MEFTPHSTELIEFISKKIKHKVVLNDTFVKKINDIVAKSKPSHKYEYEYIKDISSIHDNNSAPLIYVLYKLMNKHNLLESWLNKCEIDQRSIKYLMNCIDNFQHFKMWHVKQHHNICDIKDIPDTHIDIQELTKFMYNGDVFNKLIYENPFASIDIHQYVETHDFKHYRIDTKNIDIDIISQKSQAPPNPSILVELCNIVTNLADYKRPIKLNILYTPIRKYIIYGGAFPISINSGSTMKHSFINLWREEEITKVLLHELVHYVDIDFTQSTKKYKQIVEYLSKNYVVIGQIKPYEAYTDSLAILLNCIFTAHHTNRTVEELVNIEINFVLFQAAKVLDNFKFDNIKDLMKNISVLDENPSHPRIYQTTSIFSYYIIKSALLYSVNNFILYHEESLKNGHDLERFKDLIDESMHNEKYIETMNEYLRMFKNKNNDYVWKTMRMSSVQIEI